MDTTLGHSPVGQSPVGQSPLEHSSRQSSVGHSPSEQSFLEQSSHDSTVELIDEIVKKRQVVALERKIERLPVSNFRAFDIHVDFGLGEAQYARCSVAGDI
ncbi:MAG: hypothetical protein LE180_06255 [Endomicrobium sp.]|uniref:hypothetical protein n=1 Tax=Candidatus Endomicrobiellum pyrsonymphae TaxID=1408203 RepID=UPI00357CBA2E|nr:hypothetical protein [Endomicrobium sp.]